MISVVSISELRSRVECINPLPAAHRVAPGTADEGSVGAAAVHARLVEGQCTQVLRA